jgi:hypothetical protein
MARQGRADEVDTRRLQPCCSSAQTDSQTPLGALGPGCCSHALSSPPATIITIRDTSVQCRACMSCLRTGGLLNEPLLSLTHARSRPVLRRFERHVSSLSLMIEVAAARQADRAPAVSCQSGFAWQYKGRATFTAQPKASPVLPYHAAWRRGADRLAASAGLQVLLSSCRSVAGGSSHQHDARRGEASDDPMLGT